MTSSASRWLLLTPLVLAVACDAPPDDELFADGGSRQPDAGRHVGNPGLPPGTVPDGGHSTGPPPTPVTPPKDASARRVIYQLVVRTFSNTNPTRKTDGTRDENGVGRFNDINRAAISSLKALGVTDVWLTGVLRQATLTDYPELSLPPDDPDVVKGRAGSFYAVRDYFDVSPDYAVDRPQRLAEFDALVSRLHQGGMKVFIDFVPNHVARGYHSVVKPELDFGLHDDKTVFFKPDNNHFYLVDPPGQPLKLTRPGHWNPAGVTFDGAFALENGAPGRPPKVTGLDVTSANVDVNAWYETIQLNYGRDFRSGQASFSPVPSTWKIMDQVLAYWQDRGVDGFRCDFAHVIPNEAWVYLVGQARQRNPQVYFFAEAYADQGHLVSLLQSGFDAIYHDPATDQLKRIYQGTGSHAQFAEVMGALGDGERSGFLHYLENHDERRVASPVVPGDNPDASGFGGLRASYQLAPLVYLYSNGPVMLFNGQELGERGEGVEGYGGEDGRTTLFDYWSSPEIAKWVNHLAYDGGGLSAAQKALRSWYSGLLSLSQTPAALGGRYWGLEYFNQTSTFADCPDDLYTFARFGQSKQVMVVVANFAPGKSTQGRVRLPDDLVTLAGLPDEVTVTLQLDDAGRKDLKVATLSKAKLSTEGFEVNVPDQGAHVFLVK